MRGWPARKGGAPAEEVVAFLGDRFLAARRPTEPRLDVAVSYGRKAGFAGYAFASPLKEEPDRDELRVFGVLDGRASELESLDGG